MHMACPHRHHIDGIFRLPVHSLHLIDSMLGLHLENTGEKIHRQYQQCQKSGSDTVLLIKNLFYFYICHKLSHIKIACK